MKIFSTTLCFLGTWKTDFNENLPYHPGPACVITATTLLVYKIWGKYYTASFICIAMIARPLYYRQINYLMSLDVHDSMYATALLGIPIFCARFPLSFPFVLTISMALAYSLVIRGIRLRQKLQEHQKLINELNLLNTQLFDRETSLNKNIETLKQDLELLSENLKKKKDLQTSIQNTETSIKKAVKQVTGECENLDEYVDGIHQFCNTIFQKKDLSQTLQNSQPQLQQIITEHKNLDGRAQNLDETREKLMDRLKHLQEEEFQFQNDLKELHAKISTIPKPSGIEKSVIKDL